MDQAKQRKAASIVVLGVGNPLLGDEGLGIEAIHRLREDSFSSEVLLVEGGTSSLDVFLDLGERHIEKLIVVDAVRAGKPPGAVTRVDLSDGERIGKGLGVSLHDLGLLDSLRLARLNGFRADRAVLLGLEPERVDWGQGLSWTVLNALPALLDRVREEIAED